MFPLLKAAFEREISKERPKYIPPPPPEGAPVEPPKPIFKIKPSILGSKCNRMIFYSATGVSEDVPFPLVAKKRMVLGNAIGDMLTEKFLAQGILLKYRLPDGTIKVRDGKEDIEFPVSSDELYIQKGKIDGVFVIDGKLWIGEYKSINQNGFDQLTRPHNDHLIQGVSYLYIFNKLLQEGKFSHIPELQPFTKAEGLIILYVNKNDTDMKEYVITNADQSFTGIVGKIMQIKYFAENNILPPCTPDYGRTCNCNWKVKSKNNQIK